MRRSTSARATVAAASALALLASGVALADDVDITPERIGVEAGRTGTLDVVLVASDAKVQNADDVRGCNADGSAVTVDLVASPNKSWVTVSPARLVFTACGVPQRVTVTVADSAPVDETTHVTGTATGGRTEVVVTPGKGKQPPTTTVTTSQFRDDKVNVTVLNTAPTVAVTGIGSASYEIGSEPAPGCAVADVNEPGASATAQVDRSALAHGLGTVTVSCAFTDAHGAPASDTASYTVVDTGAPTITASLDRAAAGTGWFNLSTGAPTARFACADDGGSGIATCTADTAFGEGAAQTSTGTAVDHGGNTATADAGPVDVDLTAPTLTAEPTTEPNSAGWYRGDVTVRHTAADALSGATAPADAVVSVEGASLASAPTTVTDAAGNVSRPAQVTGLKIDRTAPAVTLVGGPAAGSSHLFGDTPAAATCDAGDALSGLAGACTVTGHSTAVGTHTVKATATDVAGNTTTVASTYTVTPWTVKGFHAPVDTGGVLNTVKGGSTVPLKFEVFKGTQELTSTSVVSSLTRRIPCGAGAQDPVELTATGGTSLRYDASGGQFVFNWQSPATPGACYAVSVTAADGTARTASFLIR